MEITYETTIPSDVEATVKQITALLNSNGIPRSVGLSMLREAGFPIESIEEALAAVNAEDTEGAKDIADALQSEQGRR